jgi:hypothetical protein
MLPSVVRRLPVPAGMTPLKQARPDWKMKQANEREPGCDDA